MPFQSWGCFTGMTEAPENTQTFKAVALTTFHEAHLKRSLPQAESRCELRPNNHQAFSGA